MWKEYDEMLLSDFANEVKQIVEGKVKVNETESETKLKFVQRSDVYAILNDHEKSLSKIKEKLEFVQRSDVYAILDYLATQRSLEGINFRVFKLFFAKQTGNIFQGYSGVLYNMLNKLFFGKTWELEKTWKLKSDKISADDNSTADCYTVSTDFFKKVRSF
jgi:hypothetical protein